MPDRREAIPIEVLGGCMAALKGLLLTLPLGQFGSAPAFRLAATFAPQWAWGAAMLAVGVLQLAAVRSGGGLFRRRSAVVAMAMWLAWGTILTAASAAASGAIATYGTLAAAQGWAAWRR